MELECEEGEGAGRHGDSSTLLGETSTGADDAGEFSEGGGLVGGVLEGVDGHGGVHGGGLVAPLRAQHVRGPTSRRGAQHLPQACLMLVSACAAPLRRRCREAADGEARHGDSSTGGGGEAETLRARFGLRDGDGGEVDALHGESSTGKVGAGLAGDPAGWPVWEGGAAHAGGDVAEARDGGEAEVAGEVAEVQEG